jgi:hypothetical protein
MVAFITRQGKLWTYGSALCLGAPEESGCATNLAIRARRTKKFLLCVSLRDL